MITTTRPTTPEIPVSLIRRHGIIAVTGAQQIARAGAETNASRATVGERLRQFLAPRGVELTGQLLAHLRLVYEQAGGQPAQPSQPVATSAPQRRRSRRSRRPAEAEVPKWAEELLVHGERPGRQRRAKS
jgi:hypothetical protein